MTAATADLAAYLAAVRSSLRDLPDAERDDLLAEVEASLVESAGEGGSISARLGPPEEFAAELRSAAGLHETSAHERGPSRLELLASRLANDPRAARVRSVAHELAPIWWVARGYVVTNGNRPLFNVFPIRYYEPGTRRVQRPNTGPYIEHPHVVTPPLGAKRR